MRLLKPDWTKDTVYLVQFPRSASVPNLSPFCLKLETWLRMTDITYQEFDKDLDADLKASDKADCRAYHALVEDSLRWAIMYHRSKKVDFYVSNDQGIGGHVTGVKKFLFETVGLKLFRRRLQTLVNMQGIGRHTLEEVNCMAIADLTALVEFLDDRKFINGDKLTTLDATIFGHLSQIYYAPMYTDTIKVFMNEQKNLVDYMDRMKTTFWPDWDEIISKLTLDTDWKQRDREEGQ